MFSSVAQSCPTLCDPMNHSTPGLPVHHQLPEFTQTHVHRVGDAIQPSHPLSSPSPPAPHSLPASESFPISQLFAWGGQSTGVSALASFLSKKSQGWSPSEWTGWISLQSKGPSGVFSNTTVHEFFGAQPSSQSNSDIHTWPLADTLREQREVLASVCFNWICTGETYRKKWRKESRKGREMGRKKGECEICSLVRRHYMNRGSKCKVSNSQMLGLRCCTPTMKQIRLTLNMGSCLHHVL